MSRSFDVIVMGGGHNGLVAANYLALHGKSVLILEAGENVGGATQSVRAFPDFDARLSRYSYLVSLLPDQIVTDLSLNFRTLERAVSSYTPYVKDGVHGGLYVASDWDEATAKSFRTLTGSHSDIEQWRSFYQELATVAQQIAPTLLQPLPTRAQLKEVVGNGEVWRYLFERPLGEVLRERFSDDLIQGVILTDGLVGTYASAFELQSNICFLYHVMGNGTGKWRVPEGGMGALVDELVRISKVNGVGIAVGSRVVSIETSSSSISVTTSGGDTFDCQDLVAATSAHQLHALMGWPAPNSRDGAQLKINLLLERLPRLKSGDDPRKAFAGTFHINERMSQFESVYVQTQRGEIPDVIPAEMYCHTLTDSSILSRDLAASGYHTLTIFGFHTPAHLFDSDNEAVKSRLVRLALDGLNQYLAQPIESVIAKNHDGSLAIEAKSPLDLESELGLPRGNIFHNDLTFPMREEEEKIRWGSETAHPRIFLAGAGARRGGGVSGIAGHNAAMAILNR